MPKHQIAQHATTVAHHATSLLDIFWGTLAVLALAAVVVFLFLLIYAAITDVLKIHLPSYYIIGRPARRAYNDSVKEWRKLDVTYAPGGPRIWREFIRAYTRKGWLPTMPFIIPWDMTHSGVDPRFVEALKRVDLDDMLLNSRYWFWTSRIARQEDRWFALRNFFADLEKSYRYAKTWRDSKPTIAQAALVS